MVLATAVAPVAAARPKTADRALPEALYCDRLPSDVPYSYTCIASETIQLVLTTTCTKDNSWFADSLCVTNNRSNPTTVSTSSWSYATISNTNIQYHRSDDLYWYQYKRKVYLRDHPNPSTPDGVWYAPEGPNGYVASSNYNCDGGFPAAEVCRFN